MKRLLALCLAALPLFVFAGRIDHILALAPQTINAIPQRPCDTVHFVSTPFAEPRLNPKNTVEQLLGTRVTHIQLVYTTYRQSPTFNQQRLNRQRLENLRRIAPEWFNSPAIQWSVVAQTGCKEAQYGDGYYHGFIIYNEPAPTTADLDAELALLDEMVQKIQQVAPPPDTSQTRTTSGDPSRTMESFEIKTHYDERIGYVHDTIWKTVPVRRQVTELSGDSLVLSVIARHPNWDSMLVVVDVTNSMSPYAAQVLQWIRIDLMEGRTLHYTFFNDGDGKSDGKKIPGKTGGIYHQTDRTLDPTLKTIKKAMSKCKNNDLPENDIEGLLAGLKACPECKEVVMVVDNYSRMRDAKLMTSVTKPVHIIPCGVTHGINMEYIDLARKTGGTIHLMGRDYSDLHLMKEGETREILGITYGIVNGKLDILEW